MTWTYISELDAFEIYHLVQEQSGDDELGAFSLAHALRSALYGAGGTAVSNIVTYPLDLVCTRLQVQSKSDKSDNKKYEGVIDAIKQIYSHEGGLSAFYNGLAGDTTKSVIDSFMFFFAYNLLWRGRKRYLPAATNPLVQASDGLAIGFLAGAFTKALTSPIQNIVTKQQTQRGAQEQSALQIARDIYKQKGLAGFWSGYESSLVLTINPSLTFFLDAALRKALGVDDVDDASAAATFILAANGKATANVITYPFKVAKIRAQADSTQDKGTTEQKPESKNPVYAVKKIARTEGVGALYAGVGGELLKGFFQHGLTMLVKEQLPMFALRLYLIIANWRRQRRKMKS